MYNGDSSKTRTNITIDRELKARLEQLAAQDNRSFNNLVIHILKTYVDNQVSPAV